MILTESQSPICKRLNDQLRLLETFIFDIEETNTREINCYRSEKPKYHQVDSFPVDGGVQNIGFYHYKGIDDWDYNLDDMFTQILPSLQRRSAFLSIFGIFEHELEMVCIFHNEKTKQIIKVNDLKGSGVERSHFYLKKIANFKNPTIYTPIKGLQKLRNIFAHNDGYLDSEKEARNKINYLINSTSLGKYIKLENDRVELQNGSLTSILELLKEYSKEIQQTVEPKNKVTDNLFKVSKEELL